MRYIAQHLVWGILIACPLDTATAQCPPVEVTEVVHSLATNGMFGSSSSAIDGELLIVGAPTLNPTVETTGAAVLFERDLGGADAWGELKILVPVTEATIVEIGDAVAVSGDTVAASYRGTGANNIRPGSVYVFERDQGGTDNWGQVTELTASDGLNLDFYGAELALDGDVLAVGAPRQEFSQGAVYIYERDLSGANQWGQRAKLTVPGSGFFGDSLDLDGDTLVVGAQSTPQSTPGVDTGSAYIFERNAGGPDAWGLVAELTLPDTDGSGAFGAAVAIYGDTAIATAPLNSEGGQFAGAGYAFERNAGGANAWGFVAKLLRDDVAPGQFLSFEAAIDGDALLFGATSVGSGGQAVLFVRDASASPNWIHAATIEPANISDNDSFGRTVALSGTTAAVTAMHSLGLFAGSCYIFDLLDGESVTQFCTPGTTTSGCQPQAFGAGVPTASQTLPFDVEVTGVEGAKVGVVFYGVNGETSIPWNGGSSTLCAVPPLQRTSIQFSGGTSGACDGTFTLDWNAYLGTVNPVALGTPFAAGDRVWVQSWFRDPPSPGGSNLSGGVSFTLCP